MLSSWNVFIRDKFSESLVSESDFQGSHLQPTHLTAHNGLQRVSAAPYDLGVTNTQADPSGSTPWRAPHCQTVTVFYIFSLLLTGGQWLYSTVMVCARYPHEPATGAHVSPPSETSRAPPSPPTPPGGHKHTLWALYTTEQLPPLSIPHTVVSMLSAALSCPPTLSLSQGHMSASPLLSCSKPFEEFQTHAQKREKEEVCLKWICKICLSYITFRHLAVTCYQYRREAQSTV